jgi:Recombination endonuclease VII
MTSPKAEYQRQWRNKNLEARRKYHREYLRQWKIDHPVEYAARVQRQMAAARARRAADPERHKVNGRRHAGRPVPTRPEPTHCERCEKEVALMKKKTMHLDHDHETGKFRGWLCNRCNLGIGMLGDTVEDLRQAVAYLERAQ